MYAQHRTEKTDTDAELLGVGNILVCYVGKAASAGHALFALQKPPQPARTLAVRLLEAIAQLVERGPRDAA